MIPEKLRIVKEYSTPRSYMIIYSFPIPSIAKIISMLLIFLMVLNNNVIAKNRLCYIKIINKLNAPVVLKSEIADTFALIKKGLMFRKKVGENRGMLFVFKREGMRNFWMKNTYIPLSIAYINRNGVINEIYSMKPLDISITYPSSLPAQYALEVNRGWFKKNNISVGCRIVFNGCLGK